MSFRSAFSSGRSLYSTSPRSFRIVTFTVVRAPYQSPRLSAVQVVPTQCAKDLLAHHRNAEHLPEEVHHLLDRDRALR
jgi:hypothetical protein